MSQTMGSRSNLFRAFARKSSVNAEKSKKFPTTAKMSKGNDDLEVEVEQVMQQEKPQPEELPRPIQGSISSPITLSRQILHDLRMICRGVGRLIEVYLLWVVLATILEHFAPGITNEISANLTEVWRILCPAVRPEGFHLGWAFFHPWEAVWHFVANNLPFLG